MSRDLWKRWAKTGPNSVASSFRTLGWSSSGFKALEGFKPLRSLVTLSFETTMSSLKGADLLRNGTSLWSLVEHIHNLSIKFLSLFNFRSCDTSSSSRFKGRNTLIVFFSDYWCTDRSLGDLVALTSPTKLFTYKSCCFLTSSLISLLKVSNIMRVSRFVHKVTLLYKMHKSEKGQFIKIFFTIFPRLLRSGSPSTQTAGQISWS